MLQDEDQLYNGVEGVLSFRFDVIMTKFEVNFHQCARDGFLDVRKFDKFVFDEHGHGNCLVRVFDVIEVCAQIQWYRPVFRLCVDFVFRRAIINATNQGTVKEMERRRRTNEFAFPFFKHSACKTNLFLLPFDD